MTRRCCNSARILLSEERVASPTGHLSNREAAEFLATHYDPKLKDIWLCHLSRDNNHPNLLIRQSISACFKKGYGLERMFPCML